MEDLMNKTIFRVVLAALTLTMIPAEAGFQATTVNALNAISNPRSPHFFWLIPASLFVATMASGKSDNQHRKANAIDVSDLTDESKVSIEREIETPLSQNNRINLSDDFAIRPPEMRQDVLSKLEELIERYNYGVRHAKVRQQCSDAQMDFKQRKDALTQFIAQHKDRAGSLARKQQLEESAYKYKSFAMGSAFMSLIVAAIGLGVRGY